MSVRGSQDSDWSIEAIATEAGVDLYITLPGDGEPLTAVLSLDRAQARAFGRSVLAAAGDAVERTFRPSHSPAQGD